MAVQIQWRRDTAGNWSTNNPLLAQGEIGLETDTMKAKMGNGVDNWNDLAYWPSGGGESRIEYDNVMQGNKNYPLTEGDMATANASTAPKVVGSWSQFTDCFWRVDNFNTNSSTVHSFPNRADYVAWKNANVPHGGIPDQFTEDVMLTPFDIVDSEIPIITRLYGMNNIFNGLTSNRSKAKENHLGPGSGGDALLKAIWDHFWPGYSFLWSAADFASGQDGRKSCWKPRNWTKLWSMPKLNEIIHIADTTGISINRHTGIPTNWEGFNDINPGDGLMTIVDKVAFIVEPDYASWEYTNNFSLDGLKLINRYMLDGGNNSGIVAFKLESPVAEPQCAIYLKPMGIDRLWLPYFDTTRYDMEIVYSVNADMQPAYFRKINAFEFNSGSGSSPHPSSGQFINKSSWAGYLPSGRFMGNLWHIKGSNRMRAYFRLRDKVTHKVGRLSPAHIELKINETNAPCKFMVVQDANG